MKKISIQFKSTFALIFLLINSPAYSGSNLNCPRDIERPPCEPLLTLQIKKDSFPKLVAESLYLASELLLHPYYRQDGNLFEGTSSLAAGATADLKVEKLLLGRPEVKRISPEQLIREGKVKPGVLERTKDMASGLYQSVGGWLTGAPPSAHTEKDILEKYLKGRTQNNHNPLRNSDEVATLAFSLPLTT